MYFFVLRGFSEAYEASKETQNVIESSADTRWGSAIGIHVTYTAGEEEAVPTSSKAEAAET